MANNRKPKRNDDDNKVDRIIDNMKKQEGVTKVNTMDPVPDNEGDYGKNNVDSSYFLKQVEKDEATKKTFEQFKETGTSGTRRRSGGLKTLPGTTSVAPQQPKVVTRRMPSGTIVRIREQRQS